MQSVQFIRIFLASALFFLSTATKASTSLSSDLLGNEDLWDLFQERQNLRSIMKEAQKAPFSDLSGYFPSKSTRNENRLQIINRSLQAFPNLNFKTKLLLQIKNTPDFEIQDFLYAYFSNLFESTKKKDESTLLTLTLSEKKQCLLISKKNKLTADLYSLNQIGILSTPVSNYNLLGRGFCFEILSNILSKSKNKIKNPRQKQILETTFKTLVENEIFIKFYNKPGVVGVYTPTDDAISISTPSQFDLNTLVHETAHASFNRFFQELFVFMKKNDYQPPSEFLSEPDEEFTSVANLERSPFLNLLNEFQAWMYEGQMNEEPENRTKLVNIILSYYGSGMKKEVHNQFIRDWAEIKTPEEIRNLIIQRIVKFNQESQGPHRRNEAKKAAVANANLHDSPTMAAISIRDFILSLRDLNFDISANIQAIEHFFDIAKIQQLPREMTNDTKSLTIFAEFDQELSHLLRTQQSIYHLKELSYFLSKRILPLELPKTLALLTQALQTQESSSSAQLARSTFFPDSYSARTRLDWPLALLTAIEPSSIAPQYQEVIANFFRIGVGIYITPFLENGADDFAEAPNCHNIRSQLLGISNSKMTVYQLSLNYLNYFLKNGTSKVKVAAEFAFKSEPSFSCQQ